MRSGVLEIFQICTNEFYSMKIHKYNRTVSFFNWKGHWSIICKNKLEKALDSRIALARTGSLLQGLENELSTILALPYPTQNMSNPDSFCKYVISNAIQSENQSKFFFKHPTADLNKEECTDTQDLIKCLNQSRQNWQERSLKEFVRKCFSATADAVRLPTK